MKKKKTRKELHLEFLHETDKALTNKNFEYTKHTTIDRKLDQLRNKELIVGDLFKVRQRTGEVRAITGALIDAIDIHTKEAFVALTYNVEKL